MINITKLTIHGVITLSLIIIYIYFSVVFGLKELKNHFPNYYENIFYLLNINPKPLSEDKFAWYNFPNRFKEHSIKLKKELISIIPDGWATDDYYIDLQHGLYDKMSIERYNNYVQQEMFWDQYFKSYAAKIHKLSAQLKILNIQPIFVPMMPKVYFYPEGVKKFITKPNKSRSKFLLENYLPKGQLEYFNTYEWIKKRANGFKNDVTPYAGYHLSHWMVCEITREIILKVNKKSFFIGTTPSCAKDKIDGVMWSDGDVLKAVEGLVENRYLKPSYWLPLKKEYLKKTNENVSITNIGIIGNSWSDNFVTIFRLILDTDINKLTWFYDYSGLSFLKKDTNLSIKKNVNKQLLTNEITKQNILIIVIDEKDVWLSATSPLAHNELFGLFSSLDLFLNVKGMK